MRIEKDGSEYPDPEIPTSLPGKSAAVPQKPTRLTWLSLILAITALLCSGGLALVNPDHYSAWFLIPVILLMGFSCFFAIILGLSVILGKILKMLFRRPSAPIWPALAGLTLIFIPFSVSYLRWLSSDYKAGVSYRDRNMRQSVESELKYLVEKIEERHREQGNYLPWCPADRRKDAFYDMKSLPPEVRALPTFALPDPIFPNGVLNSTLPPAYVHDPFIPVRGWPFGYYAPGAREGETTNSASGYIVWSCGPDGKYDLNAANIETAYQSGRKVPSDYLVERIYDPSNGAVSRGDIVRYKSMYAMGINGKNERYAGKR